MNRREFVRNGLFALAAMEFPRLVAAEVAEKAGLDGVFNGGDYSTANSPKALTDAEYIDQIASVEIQRS